MNNLTVSHKNEVLNWRD